MKLQQKKKSACQERLQLDYFFTDYYSAIKRIRNSELQRKKKTNTGKLNNIKLYFEE